VGFTTRRKRGSDFDGSDVNAAELSRSASADYGGDELEQAAKRRRTLGDAPTTATSYSTGKGGSSSSSSSGYVQTHAQGSRVEVEVEVDESSEEVVLTLDDLFRKTQCTPQLYWLPVSDEVVAQRTKGLNGTNATVKSR
jgi:hypothetical protein